MMTIEDAIKYLLNNKFAVEKKRIYIEALPKKDSVQYRVLKFDDKSNLNVPEYKFEDDKVDEAINFFLEQVYRTKE